MSQSEMRRRLACFVLTVCAVFAAVSCGSDRDPDPNGVMSSTNDASPDSTDTPGRHPQVPVRYTEHLVCQLEEENARWQHLYRLDLQRPGAEFVGGQGGRIVTLHSHTMGVSADWVSMTFDPSSEYMDQSIRLKTFQVQIHRSTLVYRWLWGAGQSHESPAGTPDMQGRCALLDAKHFVADLTSWLIRARGTEKS